MKLEELELMNLSTYLYNFARKKSICQGWKCVKRSFLCAGQSGGWKNVLSAEQKKRFDDWIKKNCPDPEIMHTIENP